MANNLHTFSKDEMETILRTFMYAVAMRFINVVGGDSAQTAFEKAEAYLESPENGLYVMPQVARIDEGKEIELDRHQIETQEGLEGDVLALIDAQVGHSVDYDVVAEQVHEIMSAVADAVEKFGVPGMATYPYVICEKTPIVFWSRLDSYGAENGGPAWWSNDHGWSTDLSEATVFTGEQIKRRNFPYPIDYTCAVPHQDAKALVNKLLEVKTC